ncbi:Por secretion system C-terminal sorting domain-containing protein [Dyadobacter soli]|uniref:Por secretion system C-terminal sorting domain-containing protein n=1 Tax=Dyadobacter soli TaxID=659014 RepID=A0A1G7XBL8_9BACT|nr:T9SS type A sorting domain-containing protein [Dyadobacter soli]SDG81586.1 Por secretion system C-terminal sorting domain-containing protein [Dyadobacter soli]
MKFLLNLVFAGGVISSVAAAPNNGAESMGIPMDSANVESSIASDLNGSYEIRNPYAESADESFTIAAKTAAPLATRVSCGGRIWTHGELLGRTGDDQPVYTRITEDRIYLNWNGRVADNIYILFNLKDNNFPNNPSNDALIGTCVNPVDPSTAAVNLLGTNGNGQITCNGVAMPNGNRLGVFVGSLGNTYQFIKYVDGRLRVMIKQGENDSREDNYYMGLLGETVRGQGGSYLDPQWRGVLTENMVNSCFWPAVPKPATPLPDNNCASGPSISNITNISQTALTVSFSGSGVTSLKWRIKSGSSEVRSGTTNDFGGATSTNLSFNSLTPGNYTLEIEGNNCNSGVSSRGFTVNEPGMPDCQNGPSVSSITSVTPSSATINYGGTNLHVFSWRILDGSNYAVASGRTGTLTSNTANLAFNFLQNGTYTFELKAEDCKAVAVATRSFNVSGTDTRATCTRGPSLQTILSSDATSLSFRFDGENVFAIDWKVKKDGVVIRQNRVSPTSNSPAINYGTLADGAYSLEIQGGSCKSTPTSTMFGVNVPLPIYISNFEGKSVEKGVELTWNVVSEKDGKEFEVLRYNDRMQNEEVIGTVALTDQRIGKYTFLDKNPLIGTNYYQLKQIDIDGTYTRSKIISINPGIISGTVIAPNPAQEYVDVQFSSRTAGKSDLTIYNIAGQAVSNSAISITEGKNIHRINVKKLNGGHYFMKINHGGEATKLRFIKAE